MFEISTFEKTKLAQQIFGKVDYPAVNTFTLKLFSDVVTLAGVGTEFTTPEYEQFTFANNLTNFPARTDGQSINANSMQSANVFSEDATYQSIGLFDENDELRYREVVTRTIYAGEYQKTNAGDLTLIIS
jgi:hypothetical protein